ncbi:MAG: ribosomal protein S12 methylthiotransferase RimO [Candidatus Poribacteria bacterium]|nr:MAG: ribosomal protein S12 methylthiotransferase RimO [Candidatus Poribacteria bacterium]
MSKRIHVVTLGCPKNTVDSEEMMGLLRARGHLVGDALEEADVYIVNTCAFIDAAKEESVEAILELAQLKSEHPEKRLIVAGCLAQRYAQELAQELPEVDAFVGTSEFRHIADVVDAVVASPSEGVSAAPRPPIVRVSSPAYQYTQPLPRVALTPWHYAYLKIAEGCDHKCTFCAIPSFRGRYISRPIEVLEQQARAYAAAGVKELILISQDTTWYGRDRSGRCQLPELIRRLARIEGIEWIRMLYLYPSLIEEPLLEVFAEEPKVVPYLDVPFQHIDETVLRRMGRGTRESFLRELVPRLREQIPGLALRTSFIVGFPGETEAAFEKLLDFIVESQFDHLGVFRYSPEEGTPSAEWAEQVPDAIKEQRFFEVVAVQTELSRELRRRWIGREVRVLVDGKDPETGVAVGRMATQAPEIDDVVYLDRSDVKAGAFVRARIVQAEEFDLFAEVLGDES